MRNSIWEYIELSDDEKEYLWDKCVFVFDANVLLNLYRYSRETSNKLIETFEDLSGRIWIPHQVAFESAKNRCEVIYDVQKKYKNFDTAIDNLISSAKGLAYIGLVVGKY